jgi:uncharacterized protein
LSIVFSLSCSLDYLPMPLMVRVAAGKSRPLDRLIADEQDLFRPANVRVELRDYIQLALRGSYPEVAQQPSVALRRRWLAAYVDQLVLRDAAALHDEHRDPVKVRRYLVAIATNTAGVPEHKTLHDAAGITRKTASRCDDLLSMLSMLSMLFVAEEVPAWHSNRLNHPYSVTEAICHGVCARRAEAVA